MKLQQILLLICLSFCTAVAHGADLDNMGDLGGKVLKLVPEGKNKRALETYLQILGLEAYPHDSSLSAANYGIARYFANKTQKDQCFAEKSLLFYRDIRKMGRTEQAPEGSTRRLSRPALSDSFGGSHKNLPAGWALGKALQYTKGNLNAALTLIGMCGHDDTHQDLIVNDTVVERLMAKGYSQADLINFNENAQSETICPLHTADFYVPKSLHQEADITQSLKDKITQVQAPTMGAQFLPAKYYHVMGAAFMTCQMIEKGMSARVAKRIEMLSAKTYRGIRLCQSVGQEVFRYQQLASHPQFIPLVKDLGWQPALEKLVQEGLQNAQCKKIENQSPEALSCIAVKALNISFGMYSTLFWPGIKNQIEKEKTKILAGYLYSRWFIGGKTLGVQLPCTDFEMMGPAKFIKDLVRKSHLNINVCGLNLSSEECRQVLQKQETWLIDFEWTVEQHRVGADFAARYCKVYPEGQSSDSAFCSP